MIDLTKFSQFFLYDKDGLVDGDMFDLDRVIHYVEYVKEPTTKIWAFDASQMINPQLALVDVTEAVAEEWWDRTGEADTLHAIEGDHWVCWLADKFYSREVGVMEQRVHADGNQADAQRDERLSWVA